MLPSKIINIVNQEIPLQGKSYAEIVNEQIKKGVANPKDREPLFISFFNEYCKILTEMLSISNADV